MSGLELVGFVLGALGPLEQSIKITNVLRNHFKAFGENEIVIQQLLSLLNHLQHDLKQLQSQLERRQSSISSFNVRMIETHLLQTKDKFENIRLSLSKMNTVPGRNLKHFFRASKWSEKCENILMQLEETQRSLLDVNFFLGNDEAIKSTAKETKENITTAKQEIVKALEMHKPSSTAQSIDNFQPYSQKLPISIAAAPDFHSIDSNGNYSTIEGRLKYRLLNSTDTHTSVFSILGPGGVGKTTTMCMLSHNQQLRDFFYHGIYYMKLGSDAKVENIIENLADIIRKSGGPSMAIKVQVCDSVENAMKIVLPWFMDKKYLFLVDDIWEQRGLGLSLLSLLKGMISASDAGGMVISTRDPLIASEALEVFRLDYRDPQGLDSRLILLRNARQNSKSIYNQDAEDAIRKLLKACGGLPVAHSVIGKGVLQYSLRRNVGAENAWRMYSRRQQNILEGRADEYNSLRMVFTAALAVLEETSLENKKRKRDLSDFCYRRDYNSLCVLEKQQMAPMEMLRRMWNVKDDDEIREICDNYVRVGLAEWHSEETINDQGMTVIIEGISMHDLLHDFVIEEAKRESSVQEWHRKLVEGYANRATLSNKKKQLYLSWWNIGDWIEKMDGGYLIRNICRHLHNADVDNDEIVLLVTSPDWIRLQLTRNGILQYEEDVRYAMHSINRRRECGDIGVKELEMIRDATRLSASYIRRNGSEVWFQLHGRLMKMKATSESMKNYLQSIEKSAARPILRLIHRSDGLLTSVGSRQRGLVDIGNEIWSMVVLPGGKEVICGCLNGKIMVVDLKENVETKHWSGHIDCVRDIAITAEGKYIVSVSDDGLGKVWEAGRWRLLKVLKGHSESIRGVIFSEDEKNVITSGWDNSIRIWNVESGNCVDMLQTEGCLQPTLMLEDERVVMVDRVDGDLSIWKVSNQRSVRQRIRCENLNESRDRKDIDLHSEVECVAMSEDKSKLISGHVNGSLQLWNAKTMLPLGDPWIAHKNWVSCVAFSRDGTKVVSGCEDGVIQVRNTSTGELVCQPFVGHTEDISGLSFIEEDRSIVSCSWDQTIRVWKIDPGVSKVSQDKLDEEIGCVSCSPDDTYFITGHCSGRISVWDVKTGRLLRESSYIHHGRIRDVSVTSDLRWIISVGRDKMVKISDWETLEVTTTLKGHTKAGRQLSISRSNKFVITAAYDNTIRIWDLIKRNGSHKVIKSTNWTWTDRFFLSDDEKRIVVTTCNEDDSYFVEVWDIEKVKLVRKVEHSMKMFLEKEQMMSIAGESQVNAEHTTKRVFIRFNSHEVRYGNESNSVLLGTVESSIDHYAYSKLHQVAAVVSSEKLRFMKVVT